MASDGRGFEIEDFFNLDEFLDPVETEEKMPWHQQDGEALKAYQKFMVYLRLGPERTIQGCADAWNEMFGTTLKSRSMSGDSLRFDWSKRAAAYDASLTHDAILYDAEKQIKRIQEFQEQQYILASEAADLGLKMLEVCKDKVGQIGAKDLKVSQISSFLNAVVSVIKLGTEVQATALGVDVLMDSLLDQEENISG